MAEIDARSFPEAYRPDLRAGLMGKSGKNYVFQIPCAWREIGCWLISGCACHKD